MESSSTDARIDVKSLADMGSICVPCLVLRPGHVTVRGRV